MFPNGTRMCMVYSQPRLIGKEDDGSLAFWREYLRTGPPMMVWRSAVEKQHLAIKSNYFEDVSNIYTLAKVFILKTVFWGY